MELIIDIETTSWFKDDKHKEFVLKERQDSRLKDPVKIAENHKKIERAAALSPFTGRITVIGLYDPSKEPELITDGYDDPVDPNIYSIPGERKLLEEVWSRINKYISNDARLVSFAGKDFDLPYLFIRSLINKVAPTCNYMDLIHPYQHDQHLDMKSIFGKGKLKEIAYALDCQTDNETDGSELPELWHSNPLKVVEKCRSDLIQTYKIYKEVKLWIPQRLVMNSFTEKDISI